MYGEQIKSTPSLSALPFYQVMFVRYELEIVGHIVQLENFDVYRICDNM